MCIKFVTPNAKFKKLASTHRMVLNLWNMQDMRNVVDEFKNVDHNEIVRVLDSRGAQFEIAIENTLRDFNMGTIVRSANAFGVRTVHVVGRKQWNRRGAMMTESYVTMHYHDSIDAFDRAMQQQKRQIIGIDNVPGSVMLQVAEIKPKSVLVFGQEGPGLSGDFLAVCDQIVAIEQFGSTRSLNVGVAAGIAMYEVMRRQRLDA